MTSNRVLILGGTTEANELADVLADHKDYEVITSRSGATKERKKVAGQERLGGFGGQEGLTKYLKEHDIAAVIDATHPFASTITDHAYHACQELKLPHLILQRPAWEEKENDRWIKVKSLESAINYLSSQKEQRRVFLTSGQKELTNFTVLSQHHFLARMIEPPNLNGSEDNIELLFERGPFSLNEERILLLEHKIDLIVSKNSGGQATEAKIHAAGELEIPIIMISRPQIPETETRNTVALALEWLTERRIKAH